MEEEKSVNLFEVPEEQSEQQVTESESKETETQTDDMELPDLSGLGLLDYEKQLAEQQAEASSPDPGAEEETSQAQGQEQETPKPDDHAARARYFQSKADRVVAENDKLKKLAPDALKYAPLIEAIQTDSDVIEFIQQKANNGTLGKSGNAPTTDVVQSSPNTAPQGPPEKPTRPSDYDPATAIHEVESASFKYREALEKYRDDMDEWRNNQEMVRYQQMQVNQQQQQRQQRVVDNFNILKNEYNATDEDIQDYNQWISDPNTMSIHNLWKFHQFLKSPEIKKQIGKKKTEDQMKQTKRAKMIPNTPTKVAGKANPTLSEADKFNLDLLAQNKRP